MNHLVLLGDSIFDNAAYVRGGLDVLAHLRQQILFEWKATLRAVDGSVVENVRRQTLDELCQKVLTHAGNLVKKSAAQQRL